MELICFQSQLYNIINDIENINHIDYFQDYGYNVLIFIIEKYFNINTNINRNLSTNRLNINSFDTLSDPHLISKIHNILDLIYDFLSDNQNISINYNNYDTSLLILACLYLSDNLIFKIINLNEKLNDRFFNINFQDSYNNTALIYACIRGKINVIQRLINYESSTNSFCDVTIIGHNNNTAIMMLCLLYKNNKSQSNIYIELIEKECNLVTNKLCSPTLHKKNIFDQTPLSLFIKYMRYDIADVIINVLLDFKNKNFISETNICYSPNYIKPNNLIFYDKNYVDLSFTCLCKIKSSNIINKIIHDIDPFIHPIFNYILYLCVYDLESFALYLLDVYSNFISFNSSDLNIFNTSPISHSPLSKHILYACKLKHEKLASKLIHLNKTNKIKFNKLLFMTSLSFACYNNMNSIALDILHYNIDPSYDIVDISGNTPLIIACENKMNDVASYLINNHDCNIDHINNSGQSALVICCNNKMENIAIEILSRLYSINPNYKLNKKTLDIIHSSNLSSSFKSIISHLSNITNINHNSNIISKLLYSQFKLTFLRILLNQPLSHLKNFDSLKDIISFLSPL